MLSGFEEARLSAGDIVSEPSGTLRVSASVAFGERWLMPRVAGFRKAYPRIALDLSLTDRNVDLVAENVDVALRLAPRLDGTLTATKLMDTRYLVVASVAWINEHGAPERPDDLARHDCPRLPLAGYRSAWRFRCEGQTREVEIGGSLVASSALALRRAALDGLGPTLLANWLIDPDIASGRLVDLFPEWEASAASFDTVAWLVYPSRSYVPRKVRVFIEVMQQVVGVR